MNTYWVFVERSGSRYSGPHEVVAASADDAAKQAMPIGQAGSRIYVTDGNIFGFRKVAAVEPIDVVDADA